MGEKLQRIIDFEQGRKEDKMLLGGKGANLAEMQRVGLSIPYGFTITTSACTDYYRHGQVLDTDLLEEMRLGIQRLEEKSGKGFGSPERPLLVSVRSGAPVSMPGMMDTVLNLGMNDGVARGLGEATGNMSFALDSYRRLIQMYGDVVLGIEKYHFDLVLERFLKQYQKKHFSEMTVDEMWEVIKRFQHVVRMEKGMDFPQDPWEQLKEAVGAVFRSWHNPRASLYRSINHIDESMGTAVTVQMMVFGNYDNNSGTGVLFTRNPSTGVKERYGEFLIQAQGEDVVAGIRTPRPISALQAEMPEVYDQLMAVCDKLETHYRDMQDMEFTVEQGKLFMLQTRSGKRTIQAALQIAIDMVEEGLITREEALMHIDVQQIDKLLHPSFAPETLSKQQPIAEGLPASPGAAVGRIFFHAEDVVAAKKQGSPSILVRKETSPEDIEGMIHSEGIVTARGGMTSHAAVVARSMGKCCVAGCHDIFVDEQLKVMKTDTLTFNEGDWISIDGSTGAIYAGALERDVMGISDNLLRVLEWTEIYSQMDVRANADTPQDAKVAIGFGASGIGLCRTEHMFFESERILAMREMILADTLTERLNALDKLMPYQRQDFFDMFKVMQGLPMTIRLLDPPLHEFLPHTDDEMAQLAQSLEMPVQQVLEKVHALEEQNPMLGHRGCRLAITYPEIYGMQVKAILEAALDVKGAGITPKVEIMIPLVAFEVELAKVLSIVYDVAEHIFEVRGERIDYKVGTMIEVPRAALIADKIAKQVDFFSFGTNDLTQMTLGFSRDDSGKFLLPYQEQKIFNVDPFVSLDQEGVGALVALASEKGRSQKPILKLGICGEQGGDLETIGFALKTGIDYVSCSPYRVPLAKLAAAQATIRAESLLKAVEMG